MLTPYGRYRKPYSYNAAKGITRMTPVISSYAARQVAKVPGLIKKAAKTVFSKPEATNAKRTVAKRRRRPAKKVSKGVSLKRQVKEMKRTLEADTGTHISRVRNLGSVKSAVNLNNYANVDLCTISTVETVLGQLRYYNPSVPGTLTNADGAAGSFQKEFLFKSIYHKIHIRNNYQVPVHVSAYIVVPKEDTDINSTTAYTNGLADVGNISSFSNLSYFTDSIQVTDLFKISSSKKILLEPGETFNMIHTTKSFQYDPSYVDNHALTYQKRFGGAMLFIQVRGEVAHDTTASEVGCSAAGVDYMVDTTYTVRYSAGADIKYIVVTDNSSSFTNGAVLSNKPTADNQGYSVA